MRYIGPLPGPPAAYPSWKGANHLPGCPWLSRQTRRLVPNTLKTALKTALQLLKFVAHQSALLISDKPLFSLLRMSCLAKCPLCQFLAQWPILLRRQATLGEHLCVLASGLCVEDGVVHSRAVVALVRCECDECAVEVHEPSVPPRFPPAGRWRCRSVRHVTGSLT